jgi:hypothetical protein
MKMTAAIASMNAMMVKFGAQCDGTWSGFTADTTWKSPLF